MHRTDDTAAGLRTLALGALLLAACGGGSKGTDPPPGGSLAVTVTGLPGGTAGRVTVTGPGGFTRNLGATTQFDGLPAGTYQVSAGYVNAAGQTWTATPAPDSAVVAVDDTVAVAVAYAGSPAPTVNLSIAGTQVIQSTQRADGAVPMIAGRDAMVRVFVVASGANGARPAVRLRLFQAGVAVDSVTVASARTSVPLTADTATLSATWNVLVPAARVLAGLSYQLELDPGDAVPETDEGDNQWPGGGATQAVPVQAVPPLDVRFVPVKQSVNDLTGQVNNGNSNAFVDATRRMFPIGQVAASVRATYTTDAPAYASDDGNNAWGQTLGEVNALRSADGSTQHYVGIIQVTYGGGIAGLGYIGLPASIAWDKASSAPGVIAHELGHNFGRYHAPCGGPSGPDPGYPHAGGSIGTWGLDLPGLTLKSPATFKDLMSYCNPSWISDYNYLAILTARGTLPDVVPVRPAARTRGLLVWGRIVAGRVILEPAFVVDAPPRLPPRAGPHHVEGLDAAGLPLFRLSFEGHLVPDLPHGDETHFAWVVPLSAREEARLARLHLVGRGLTAIRAPGTAPVGGGKVGVEMSGGSRVLRWDPGYPMAVVRDARTGEIVQLARGGRSRLEAGGRALSVELTDGVRSGPAVRVAP